MSKKHFIALADAIKQHNKHAFDFLQFTPEHLNTLADFCRAQNGYFNRDRWFDYIAGKCGPNGGSVKPQ